MTPIPLDPRDVIDLEEADFKKRRNSAIVAGAAAKHPEIFGEPMPECETCGILRKALSREMAENIRTVQRWDRVRVDYLLRQRGWLVAIVLKSWLAVAAAVWWGL